MSDSIAPESRIFRIGRECYVVYLGKERDDVRPFLRIGNTRDIPDEVHQVISTTVVTDDHVGNPLLEIMNAAKVQGRYLGDTAVVGEIRKFFKSFDLSTNEVTDYRKVKDGEKRHMVWFYSSGNIHLRFDEQVIFDLHKREKEDRHFVRLYEEAKAEFLRNPLRYIRQDFVGPGMILAEGNVFWYEGGEMLALMAHSGFVARLMKDGMDPDFITASVYDLEPEEMDSHDAAVYVGFVKRMRQRRKQLRVLSSKPELQRKLRLLFPARGDVPATLEVVDVSGKRKATFRDSIISKKEGTWRIHRGGLPEITIGGELENGISIEPGEGTISIWFEGIRRVLNTPQGFPIDFNKNPLPDKQLVDRYIGLVYNNIKEHLTDGESQAVIALEKYIRLYRDDITAGKASVSPLLKQTMTAARDAVKNAGNTNGGPSWYFYSNVLTVLGLLRSDLDENHPLHKNPEPVMAALRNLLSQVEAPENILPFWADLYVTDEPYILWRATKRNFVAADLATTRNSNESIRTITSLDEAPWQEDEERLLKLIHSLGQGGQGPLTDEQLELLKQPDAPEKAPEKKEADNRKSERGPVEKISETSVASTVTSTVKDEGKTSKRKSSGGKGRPGLWILLVLLLLLLGGAVVWDLSGKAPWGSILSPLAEGREEQSSDSDTRDEGDAQEGGSEGESASVTDTGDSSSTETPSGTEGSAGDSTDGSDKSAGEASGSETSDSENTGNSGSAGSETGESGSSTESGSGNAGIGSNQPPVDPDVAPRTLAEVKAYLDINGRIPITEADIHLAANEIAVINGFKDLDYRVYTGEDPDWIYPGNSLELPGAEDYVIRRGDTIWFLAAREVRVDVEKDLERFDSAVATLDNGDSSEAEKRDALAILADIAGNSRGEVMRQMAADAEEMRE